MRGQMVQQDGHELLDPWSERGHPPRREPGRQKPPHLGVLGRLRRLGRLRSPEDDRAGVARGVVGVGMGPPESRVEEQRAHQLVAPHLPGGVASLRPHPPEDVVTGGRLQGSCFLFIVHR